MQDDKHNIEWESWQLTAFALGELEGVDAEQIAAAVQRDESLAVEVQQIRQTTGLVAEAFKADATAGLSDESLTVILSQAEAEVSLSPTPEFIGGSARYSGLRGWLMWGGCAVAASGLVAALSYPAWMPGEAQNDLASAIQPRHTTGGIVQAEEGHSDELESSVAAMSYGSAGNEGSELDATHPLDGSNTESVSNVSNAALGSADKPVSGAGMGMGGYGGPGATVGGPAGTGARPFGMGGPGMGGYGGEGGYTGGGPGSGDGGYAGGGMGGGYGGMGGGNGGDGYGGGGYGIGPGMGGPGDAQAGGSGLPDLLGGPVSETDFGDQTVGGLGAGAGGKGNQPAGEAKVSTAATVPEGGTISLGGIRRTRGGALQKAASDRSNISMSVTPRIIIQEEEEEAFGIRGRRADGRGVERYGSIDLSRDRYAQFNENEFALAKDNPLSTFSIDVDTAAYSKCRQLLLENQSLPPADAVRLEEFINYFEYEYAGPEGEDPFAANLAVTTCPWAPKHNIVRIALQADKQEVEQRPAANIVFLLDVSGSMSSDNKLPLVKESMRMLIRQLGENDRVAMVVYAGAAGCVLESTTGDRQSEILDALDRLQAGGSTNGGQGIRLAYDIARDHFIKGGVNRVILCSDGDFNVGVTSTDALVNLVAENARSKVFMTVLGYGMGNTNDAMMEKISNKGNGVYGFVDNRREAHRQMVKQLAGNLITVAKDVKIQVEFNPAKVKSYRLLGYENRVMANEDFNDDTKDAGEIGAGHRVTAMYEIVPVGVESQVNRRGVDPLRYQASAPEPASVLPEPEIVAAAAQSEFSGELLAVKLRYKQPEGDTSKLLLFPLADEVVDFESADRDFQWAASMVQFGMLLRGSHYKGTSTWSQLVQQASAAAGISPDQDRQECLTMIRTAKQLSGR